MAQIFKNLGAALAIFTVIGESVVLAADIRDHTPAQQSTWETFRNRFGTDLGVAEKGTLISRAEARLLNDDLAAYIRSFPNQEKKANILHNVISDWIETSGLP